MEKEEVRLIVAACIFGGLMARGSEGPADVRWAFQAADRLIEYQNKEKQ